MLTMARWMAGLGFLLVAAQPQKAPAADKPAACTLQRIAELDADVRDGHLLIKVGIEGRESWFQVDTGSPFNMINRRLAAELNLPLHEAPEGAAIDAAGKSARHYVNVHKLTLGVMSTSDITPSS